MVKYRNVTTLINYEENYIMSNKFGNSFIWHEKYSPQTVEETILPRKLKEDFLQVIKDGEFSHLLFSGTAGVGKTSLGKVLCKQLGLDYIYINASLESGIDVLRTRIQDFASTVSLMGGKKVIICDEADGLTDATQKALRGFIDEFDVRFIFTCNFPHKLIDPLKGRCTHYTFDIPESDKNPMMKTMYGRVIDILKAESITFEVEPVKSVIRSNFPNFRKTLIQLQQYSLSGTIDIGVIGMSPDVAFGELVDILKKKSYNELRTWVTANVFMDKDKLFSDLYKKCDTFIKPQSIPQMVLTLADYGYKSTFAVSQEINTLAMLTELMSSCDFKE